MAAQDIAGLLSLLGPLGLIGVATLRWPVPAQRPGGRVRLLGLLGLLGLAGPWIAGVGACGALGAFGAWNHPKPALARLARLGFLGLLGVPFLAQWAVGLAR